MFTQAFMFAIFNDRNFEQSKMDSQLFLDFNGYSYAGGHHSNGTAPYDHDEDFWNGTPINKSIDGCLAAKCKGNFCYAWGEPGGTLLGFRPVVCLNKDVLLKTNDNGQTYYL